MIEPTHLHTTLDVVQRVKDGEIQWNNIPESLANFIFQQAKDHVTALIDISDKLDTKLYTILGISFALMNALIAYICTQQNINSKVLFACILYILALGIINLLLVLAIMPRRFQLIGKLPDKFLTVEVLKHTDQDIILGEANSYIVRAQKNRDQINKKSQVISWALYGLIFSPFLVGLIVLIATICL